MSDPIDGRWSRRSAPDVATNGGDATRNDVIDIDIDERAFTSREDRLALWEEQLRQEEHRLSEWATWLQRETGFTPAWSLSAEPVTHVLRALHRDAYCADDDVETFAAGFGLDAVETRHLLRGEVDELNVEQIADVCEALKCSPYDLWGAKDARTILHAYGPERWPRYIEPLDADDDLPTDDTFIRRRLDQQTAEIVVAPDTLVRERPSPSDTTDVLVTCYRDAGVLAVKTDDAIALVEDASQPADKITGYHLAFQQIEAPRRMTVTIAGDAFDAGAPPGYDAEPTLAEIASRLRQEAELHETAMVRFSAVHRPSEQWLGLDPASGTWQTWDDPRAYFPGDPSQVLDNHVDDVPLPLDGAHHTGSESIGSLAVPGVEL